MSERRKTKTKKYRSKTAAATINMFTNIDSTLIYQKFSRNEKSQESKT